MGTENENIEIRLIAKAEVADATKMESALIHVDRAAQQASQSLARVGQGGGNRVGSGFSTGQQHGPFLSPENRERLATDQHSKELGADFAGLKTPLLAAGGAALAGLGVAASAAAKGLHEYSEAERIATSLDAALAQRGLLTKQYREELHALAGEMAKLTNIQDDTWVEVIKTLTQFGADSSNIKESVSAVENLAGILGGDVQQASMMMGRALQGSFEIFGRYGIHVNEASSQTEKLNEVMQKTAQLGAGQLRAQNETLTGTWKGVKNAVNEVFESFGGMIARSGLLQSILGMAKDSLNELAQSMGGVPPVAQSLNNSLATSSQRLDAVQASAAAAAREFNSIEKQSERATHAMDRQRSAAERLLHAQDELAGARLQLDLAQIDAAEHSRQLTPQQAAVARAQARRQSEVAELQRHQAADADTIQASERRLAELTGQRGRFASDQSAARAQLEREQQGHAARAELANAELEMQRAEAEERRVAALRYSPEGGPSEEEIQRLEVFANERSQLAYGRASSARDRVAQFSGTSDQGLARSQERLAKATEDLAQASTELRNLGPALQDAISNARLSQDVRAARFGIDQRREGVELQDSLTQLNQQSLRQGPVNRTTAGTPPRVEDSQEYQALQAAFAMYAASVQSGQRTLADTIMRDIRNLDAQVRSLSARR